MEVEIPRFPIIDWIKDNEAEVWDRTGFKPVQWIVSRNKLNWIWSMNSQKQLLEHLWYIPIFCRTKFPSSASKHSKKSDWTTLTRRTGVYVLSQLQHFVREREIASTHATLSFLSRLGSELLVYAQRPLTYFPKTIL